jgi:hypothetical protein
LVTGGDVLGFYRISPDGSRVAYKADQATDEVYGLYIARGPEHWMTNGGSWDTADHWEFGIAPDLTTDAVLDAAAVVTMTGGTTPRTVDTLTLGGGAGTSVLELQGGAVLTATDGLTMLGNGVLGGDGVVSTGELPLSVPASAEIGAGAGDTFTLISGTVTNAGRIEALGSASSEAELDFVGNLKNQTSTGLIAAHDAVLRFRSGLLNAGHVTVSGGFNDVFGEIINQPTGRIVVSGGSAVVCYDDVSNAGVIQASASGSLQSMIVFFGSFSGNGVSGTGHVFLEGDARPGFSPGTMVFGGDVSLGPDSALHIEISDTKPGTGYDRFTAAGDLALGGALELAFVGGFTPAAGMRFDLWDANSVSGKFSSVSLPALPAGLFWHASKLATTGELAIGVTPETFAGYAALFGLSTPATGDQDNDGLANRLEYVLGQNPTIASNGAIGLPLLVKSPDTDTYSFTMPAPCGADVAIAIEASDDLVVWSVLANRPADGPWSGPVTLAADAPGRQRVTLNRPSAGVIRRFYRLVAPVPR